METPNVYYHPEKFGLSIVGEVDFDSAAEDYGFEKLVVWRQVNGAQLYWAGDAGCSCPLPFADATNGLADLYAATPHEVAAMLRAKLAADAERLTNGDRASVHELITTVMRQPRQK